MSTMDILMLFQFVLDAQILSTFVVHGRVGQCHPVT